MISVDISLSKPAIFKPYASGVYEVGPGMKPLGFDFGNGTRDKQIFQIDKEFYTYREKIDYQRKYYFSDHILTRRYTRTVNTAVIWYLVDRLCAEYPDYFSYDLYTLYCHLTHEVIEFTENWELSIQSEANNNISYVFALDALASQIQEDVAITSVDKEGNWISALHVCIPSGWEPKEKIGLNWADAHFIVPGMQKIVTKQQDYVKMMLQADPGYVRFVWSPFIQDEEVWVLVERQMIVGLPEVGAAIFLIRPYRYLLNYISPERSEKELLIKAIESMSPESLKYKGLDNGKKEEIIKKIKASC